MLVVGLGNPGTRYARTPHNVGFRVLDGLVPTARWSERFEAQLLVTQIDAQELVLLKPLTFMNTSGKSVRKAMAFFKIPPQSTLVVHDELDLPLGAVKLKRGGGEAGHRGLESVSAEIESRDYLRLRVGVGKPQAGAVADYLLAPFSEAAEQQLVGALALAGDAVQVVARHGIDRAMNQVNRAAASGGVADSGIAGGKAADASASGSLASGNPASENLASGNAATPSGSGRPD